jgi:hypothetical protein
MKNIKKAFFILTFALVSTAAQARCYDCDDRYYRPGVVERTGRAAGDVAEGTVNVAEDVAAVPGDVVGGVLFGGERRRERREEREERRERRREERELRRGY